MPGPSGGSGRISALTTAERPLHPPHDAAAGAERDPVCGMSVNPATARHRAEHAGHSYVFCGARCRERFVAEPARFLAPAPATVPPEAAAEWTCPMHPEVVRPGPGACP